MEDPKAAQGNKKKKKPVSEAQQTHEFVHRLILYFQRENDNAGPLVPLRNVNRRVAEALGIGRRTVGKILTEVKCGKPLVTPGIKRDRGDFKATIEPLDESAFRNIIYTFYERQEWPSIDKLFPLLKESNVYHGKRTTIIKVLRNFNFDWEQINKKKYLMENSEIISARCKFLRQIRQCNLEKVIFLGETCINAGDFGRLAAGNQDRLILINAGHAKGFVLKCCQLIRYRGTHNYHKYLTVDTFKMWFINFLQKIPPNSTIVMDNSPHRSVVKEVPTTAWKYKEIQDWLTKNNVEWSSEMLKGELLELTSIQKPRMIQYELDQLAQEKGHTVIRIPPKHSDLNAIEFIWAHIKEKVNAENKTFNLDLVESLTQCAVVTITSENWETAVKQTAKNIELAWKKESEVEKNVQEMVMKILDKSKSQSDNEENGEFNLETD